MTLITVSLETQPTSGASVTVTLTTTSACTVSPTLITVANAAWNTGAVFTITAVDDVLDNPGNQRSCTITTEPESSADPDYDGQNLAEDISMTVLDDEYDSDGDGVVDALDLCPNTGTGLAVDGDGCPMIAAIAGLVAHNSSPTVLGRLTTFTATISAGNAVSYTWAFGDGLIATGQLASHSYSQPGIYTATVIASNVRGQAQANTLVTITQPIDPPVSYTLSINIVGKGAVIPSVNLRVQDLAGLYLSGTLVSLSANPDSGWQFEGWSGDLKGNLNPTHLLMHGDKVVTATFSQRPTNTPNRLYLPLIVNNHSKPTPGPDLIISDFMVSSQAITLAVQNVGDELTNDYFWVDVYVGPLTVPTQINDTWQLNGWSRGGLGCGNFTYPQRDFGFNVERSLL